MDRDGARARLAVMVAATSRPVLSPDALDLLLDDARTIDSDGRRVQDDGYVPTWNLNYAARKGWEAKAALVAGDFTFTADGAGYNKGSVLANMERMVAMYAAKDVGTLTVEGDREAGAEAGIRLGVNSGVWS